MGRLDPPTDLDGDPEPVLPSDETAFDGLRQVHRPYKTGTSDPARGSQNQKEGPPPVPPHRHAALLPDPSPTEQVVDQSHISALGASTV